MRDWQREFIEFALECGVLRFGEFRLKSGRLSPYFFNAGLFDTGERLRRLGGYYARALVESGLACDVLYGPAYKGIPLVTATAIALAAEHGRDLPWVFNRKEVKRHGEGGRLVGAPLRGRVLIVDDVVSAGTSVNESVEIIRAAGAEPVGVLVALDRRERGTESGLSAMEEIERRHGLRALAIVSLDEIVRYLERDPERAADLERLRAYQAEYGPVAGAG